MKVRFFSTYELGHQPASLAWPLAALRAAGFEAAATDLAVDDLPAPDPAVRLAAVSVPMHTALRLAVGTVPALRRRFPNAHICLFGLYAELNADYLRRNGLADSILAGEIEPALVKLAQALAAHRQPAEGVFLERVVLPVPDRSTLPALAAYARLEIDGERRLAGYSEATRGCLHTCRHCPVVPVYNGRFFVVPVETVLADVRAQVAAGAAHITFGDPDFLNGPTHALRVARALHAEFPDLTFDFTAKVAHLVQHRALLPELVACGALFVISAFESTSPRVLAVLEKGHTAADMRTAVEVCRAAGLAVHPTWVAFTPWTTLDDYLEMLRWVRANGLAGNIPVVQYAVRLLVPPGSALLETARDDFGPLDAGNFSHTWSHPDPRMDELHRAVTALAEDGCDCSPEDAFRAIETLAYSLAGAVPAAWERAGRVLAPAPRLTEDWFC